ncbi:Syntaxin-6_N domain-containing protein [Cephalotus follicularis]|uniref:Syntaxin-6_N domain-containing protein n=1 Tax=Cephalotus follicularis TaxID=3775 RepID=A0A1Q3CW18_CEPFO|nr:Syntaxin-6_N domain-containing protein [Cephalotus follicularis]
MSSTQDPFYLVKEEIQESIDKLLSSFHQWERIHSDPGEQVHLTKELLASCESIEWQVTAYGAWIKNLHPHMLPQNYSEFSVINASRNCIQEKIHIAVQNRAGQVCNLAQNT